MATMTLRELINALAAIAETDADLDHILVAFPAMIPGDGPGVSIMIDEVQMGRDGIVRVGGNEFIDNPARPKPILYEGVILTSVPDDKELRAKVVAILRDYTYRNAAQILGTLRNLPYRISSHHDGSIDLADRLSKVGAVCELIEMN